MMAVEELTASEGTQHGVDTIVHYVVGTDWRQSMTLHNINIMLHSKLCQFCRPKVIRIRPCNLVLKCPKSWFFKHNVYNK